MNSSSSSRRLRGVAGAALLVASLLGGGTIQAQETLRPEIGKPLQAAQELIKAQRYREALAKVREAEAVGARNANETFLIERMRIAAASGAGDVDTAARSFEALNGSGRISAADKIRMVESIAVGYYRAQQYPKAMQWSQRYFKEGGTSGAIRTMLIQSQYLSGDFAGASKELIAEINAAERAGQPPAEDRLKLLLNAATKQNDNNAYVFAVEKLVTYYPKKEYWVDLMSRMQRKPTFSDRLALDAYRLSLATGSMTQAGRLHGDGPARPAGRPAEREQAGGRQGLRQQRPRHRRRKPSGTSVCVTWSPSGSPRRAAARAANEKEALAAKSGDPLVAAGMNLVYSGQAAKGVQMMQQGIAKGGMKRLEDAKLHLGIAQLIAGDKAKAQATFKTVQGTDGTADLARLWMLHARRSA